MNRFPSFPSRSMRRNAEIWTVRLAGSTKILGHTRAINSCLLTNSYERSSKTIRISRARLPSGTGLSFSSSRNCAGSSRNGPNETSVGAAPAGSVRFASKGLSASTVTAVGALAGQASIALPSDEPGAFRNGGGNDGPERRKRHGLCDEHRGDVAVPAQREPSAGSRKRQPRQIGEHRPQQPTGPLRGEIKRQA